jgi:hypothetical protein
MTCRDITFLTFGDGSFAFRRAASRLKREALSTGIFSKALAYHLSDIKKRHPHFWKEHRNFILDEKNRRGLGYWLWKPYLIHATLQSLSENDVLLYGDCGCEFYAEREDELLRFLPSSEDGWDLSFFHGRFGLNDKWKVREWTKPSVISHFGLSECALDQPQVLATVIAAKNTEFARNLLGRWFSACVFEQYRLLVDDEHPDLSTGMIEHRHDQAILTGIISSLNESEKKQIRLFDGNLLEDAELAPLHAARNRSGVTRNNRRPRRLNLPFHLERLMTYPDRFPYSEPLYRLARGL